jgi:uncharacterized protein
MPNFERKILPNKVLLLLGPRRVGKTALLREYLRHQKDEDYLLLNGEDVVDMSMLETRSVAHYKRLLDGKNLLAIDEAQNIPDIGKILKLIVDEVEGVRVIATGSLAFDLNSQLGEPLVGRKNTLYLLPLSQMEFSQVENLKITMEMREERLLFGGYPEVTQYANWEEKKEYLYEIVSDYLFKDILAYEGIKNSDKLYSLLKLIAFQVGREVSLEELGRQLGMSKNTVERYLDLLAKVFVLYRVRGFSKNLRKEISKNSRWYFYDNGIRNAIIQNFNPLPLRTDVGELWENYLASERLKVQHYRKIKCQNYFWRTYDQQELDWVEEEAEVLRGYEFKFRPQPVKVPKAWKKAYPQAGFDVIHSENYLDWIG